MFGSGGGGGRKQGWRRRMTDAYKAVDEMSPCTLTTL